MISSEHTNNGLYAQKDHINVIMFLKSYYRSFIKEKERTRCECALLYLSAKLSNGSTEGLEGKLAKLEALLTEGNTNKGNAKYYAEQEVEDTEYNTAENVPKYVENGALSAEYNSLTEGSKNELSHLEVLLTERNTDKSYTECYAENEVYCSEDEAAEYAPEEITEFFHCGMLLKFLFFVHHNFSIKEKKCQQEN